MTAAIALSTEAAAVSRAAVALAITDWEGSQHSLGVMTRDVSKTGARMIRAAVTAEVIGIEA